MSIRAPRLSAKTGSPAIPAESRFDRNAMLVRKDDHTSEVILSSKTGWSTRSEYLDPRDSSHPVPDEFMADRPLNAGTPPLIPPNVLRG
jgi:hypothetical protein